MAKMYLQEERNVIILRIQDSALEEGEEKKVFFPKLLVSMSLVIVLQNIHIIGKLLCFLYFLAVVLKGFMFSKVVL